MPHLAKHMSKSIKRAISQYKKCPTQKNHWSLTPLKLLTPLICTSRNSFGRNIRLNLAEVYLAKALVSAEGWKRGLGRSHAIYGFISDRQRPKRKISSNDDSIQSWCYNLSQKRTTSCYCTATLFHGMLFPKAAPRRNPQQQSVSHSLFLLPLTTHSISEGGYS
jgi:hypothetical protein